MQSACKTWRGELAVLLFKTIEVARSSTDLLGVENKAASCSLYGQVVVSSCVTGLEGGGGSWERSDG